MTAQTQNLIKPSLMSFYHADDSEWEVSDFQSTDDSDDEWIDN